MTIGSGLFSRARAAIQHLVHPGGGLAGEIYDLRKDILAFCSPLAAIAVEEYTNVVSSSAVGAAALLDAAASVVAPVTVLAADMKALGLAQLVLWPRPVSITVAGTTPADAPATALVTGTDVNGDVLTETLTVPQTATIVTGAKLFKTVVSVVYPAADGTGATMFIGIGVAQLKVATATTVAPATVLEADLVQTGLADAPRALVFTTGGTTPANAPATALVTGKDANGKVQTETVTLAQTATTATSSKFYSNVNSIAYAAADGTDATIAIGIGAAVGLKQLVKSRAGLVSIIREIVGGSVVTNGAITAPTSSNLPNGSYTPNSAFDGVADQVIYYEYDATAQ